MQKTKCIHIPAPVFPSFWVTMLLLKGLKQEFGGTFPLVWGFSETSVPKTRTLSPCIYSGTQNPSSLPGTPGVVIQKSIVSISTVLWIEWFAWWSCAGLIHKKSLQVILPVSLNRLNTQQRSPELHFTQVYDYLHTGNRMNNRWGKPGWEGREIQSSWMQETLSHWT